MASEINKNKYTENTEADMRTKHAAEANSWRHSRRLWPRGSTPLGKTLWREDSQQLHPKTFQKDFSPVFTLEADKALIGR